MTVNEWEERSRLRKAERIAVVLGRVLDAEPSLTIDDFADRATAETKRLTAEAAGTRLPSDETWAWAIELLRVRASDRPSN